MSATTFKNKNWKCDTELFSDPAYLAQQKDALISSWSYYL